jgi:3-oxosteroid 1-dehydrogenase
MGTEAEAEAAQTGGESWDHSVDLLIIGSGAGAMTAGLVGRDDGAEVLLIEKGEQYGGSSAMSGGGLWIPCNHIAREAGFRDDPEQAWKYLKGCVGDATPDERLRAYLENAPKMLEYLVAKTRARFIPLLEYADYYPAVEGSTPGGRCLDPVNFNGKELGEEFTKMRESAPQQQILGRISMTIPEARVSLARTPGWIWTIMRLFFRYALDIPWRFKSKRDRNLAMGNALVGMLRASLMDREIPIWLETPARKLVVEDGRVVGVEAERSGRPIRIRARKAVILAAGGFEANQAMREKYLPQPSRAEWSSANPKNTGDIINMGIDIGAGLGLMDEAWWGPVVKFPADDRARFFVIELSLPGSVLVNRSGRRFVNEASPYGDKVAAMYAKNTPEGETIPSYLIFDANFRKKYPVGPLLPGQQQPDWAAPKDVMSLIVKADSPDELAEKLGIDAEGLKDTLARMNEYARTGIDPEFHRGDTIFDQYYGDTNQKPNPNLGPIDTPPYYAMRTYPGELGTKGGLLVDARARVLKENGEVIPGLYATGNCSASVMGRTYPGPGATLGPATTFGFVAARDALGSD